MSEIPERFWVSAKHNGMVGECWHNARAEKPHRHWEYNEYVRADRIEALEAKLVKAVEALELADAALSGAHMNMRVVERKVKATIAELKGGE